MDLLQSFYFGLIGLDFKLTTLAQCESGTDNGRFHVMSYQKNIRNQRLNMLSETWSTWYDLTDSLTKLCFGEGDQSEAENHGGRYITTQIGVPSALALASAPSIMCSEIGASVTVVLRPPHMKLGCNKEA
ncbi:hypothetical protein EVAR_97579_1 [Eumeta japonica]|uniref:Uncharacterized protein n=1 Tax=Eumeta variegata TaxID=151549 RepID=A0A4C1WS88_EUMVA|nr:hypothetical protein EVAR_97579_1 [Eumeta japonica]